MTISWAGEIPDLWLADEHHYVMSSVTFWALDDYTRSMPTAPSAGRVYRKAFMWSNLPDFDTSNWMVCVVADDPLAPGIQEHHCKPVLLIDS